MARRFRQTRRRARERAVSSSTPVAVQPPVLSEEPPSSAHAPTAQLSLDKLPYDIRIQILKPLIKRSTPIKVDLNFKRLLFSKHDWMHGLINVCATFRSDLEDAYFSENTWSFNIDDAADSNPAKKLLFENWPQQDVWEKMKKVRNIEIRAPKMNNWWHMETIVSAFPSLNKVVLDFTKFNVASSARPLKCARIPDDSALYHRITTTGGCKVGSGGMWYAFHPKDVHEEKGRGPITKVAVKERVRGLARALDSGDWLFFTNYPEWEAQNCELCFETLGEPDYRFWPEYKY